LQRKHIPQLDGLRGLAVLLVLLAHSAIAFTGVSFFKWIDNYGSLGVQLFFVLSGFLITGILLDSKETPRYFRNFFMRRALRIYPLYYALLGFVVFSGVVNRHGVHWWVYVLYVSNLFGNTVQPAPLGPVWSLAVEEQFYFLWPFIVYVLPRRILERLCVTMIVAAICLRFTGMLQVHNTLLQIDSLGCGALVACRFNQIDAWRRVARFVALLLPLGVSLPAGPWNNLSQTLQALGGMALLIVLLDNRSNIAGFFCASPLRYLGKISYGVYLLHSLVFAAFLRSTFGQGIIQHGSAISAVFCILGEFGIAVALATGSFYLFERPFLRLKHYYDQPTCKQQASSNEDTRVETLAPA
jgi:peptidoglycan/LPS O-acetylase OafA/YrhL